jgi:drug/metabolite transporter (DMT)-like permease
MSFGGELAALLAACTWTGSSLAFAGATSRVGSVYVNVVRLFAAAILLALTVSALRIGSAVTLAQLIFLAISGFIGLVFGDTFLFKSYEYNSARVSSLVMSAAPALTAVLAYLLFKETLSFLAILGMVITLGGITLVVLERKEKSDRHIPISMKGVFYAFLGALGQAGGLIFAKNAFSIGPINGFYATLIRVVAAIVVITPIHFVDGRFRHPIRVFSGNRKAFWFTILGAVLGPFLGITLSLVSISLTSLAIAATLMAMVPILMLPTVWLLYREKLTWRAVVGAFVAVTGVAVLFLR